MFADEEQKIVHLEEDTLGEDSFLPDQDEPDDNINPKLRALMQRYGQVRIESLADIFHKTGEGPRSSKQRGRPYVH